MPLLHRPSPQFAHVSRSRPWQMIVIVTSLACAASLASVVPASAQTQMPQQQTCQADNQPSSDQGSALSNKADESKTSRCDGVLKPPATGDQDLVTPAPSTGDMPVLRLGETPPQQTPKTQSQ